MQQLASFTQQGIGKGGCQLFLMLLACAATPLIISLTYMGLYFGLLGVAADYDDMVGKSLGGSGSDGRFFDACGLNVSVSSSSSGVTFEVPDTKWSIAFVLNAVTYLLLSLWALCLALSAFAWPLAFCGACGICLTQCLHLAAVIIAGVFRYSDDGEKCAENSTGKVTKDGDTSFEDIGTQFGGMFISQAVLLCFYGCCLGCALQVSMGIAMVKKAGV